MAWLVHEGEVLASLEVATTAADRRRGLLGRDALDGALLLRPARMVHTVRMRFPIDVLYVDRSLKIVGLHHTLKPWRVGQMNLRSRFVIELPAGTLRATNTQVGDQLAVSGYQV